VSRRRAEHDAKEAPRQGKDEGGRSEEVEKKRKIGASTMANPFKQREGKLRSRNRSFKKAQREEEEGPKGGNPSWDKDVSGGGRDVRGAKKAHWEPQPY